MFSDSLRQVLSLGDVFKSTWDVDRAESFGSVVVLNHECDIQKPNAPVLVARIVADHDTDPGLLGHIKGERVWHGYYLTSCDELGWVNFRTICGVSPALFENRLSYRLHSMTDDGRLMIAAAFFRYMTRTQPPDSGRPPESGPTGPVSLLVEKVGGFVKRSARRGQS